MDAVGVQLGSGPGGKLFKFLTNSMVLKFSKSKMTKYVLVGEKQKYNRALTEPKRAPFRAKMIF